MIIWLESEGRGESTRNLSGYIERMGEGDRERKREDLIENTVFV